MRFNRNECAECIAQCRPKAILIDEDIRVNAESCTECMLCVSACPMDVFELSGSDFYSLVGRLRKVPPSIQSPVLGCAAKASSTSHVKTSCLGFLSEEHLIALSFFMQNPLQFNFTGCSDCGNGFIMETLGKRISGIEAKTAIRISDKMRMVTSRADLDFQEISYDRRGFFKAIKNMTFAQAAGIFENEDPEEQPRSYSSKKLPLKRELLNMALKCLITERSQILKNYYFTVMTTEACNNCFACIGMCPTGALKIESAGEKRYLTFSSSLCGGCGLCRDFCMQHAVQLKKVFSESNPFEFRATTGSSMTSHQKENTMDIAERCCNGI